MGKNKKKKSKTSSSALNNSKNEKNRKSSDSKTMKNSEQDFAISNIEEQSVERVENDAPDQLCANTIDKETEAMDIESNDIHKGNKVENTDHVLENMEGNQNNTSNEYSCDQNRKMKVSNTGRNSQFNEVGKNTKLNEMQKNKKSHKKSKRIDEHKNTDKEASNTCTIPSTSKELVYAAWDNACSEIDSSFKKKSFENKNKEYQQVNNWDVGNDADKYNSEKFGKKPINRSDQPKHSNSRNNSKSCERDNKDYQRFKQKYISEKENMDFRVVNETQGDLFTAGPEYSLGHCVAEDMNMGSGIAVTFRQNFKRVPELLDQRQTQGNVAILEDSKRYIYYLVTKRVSNGKPTYVTMWSSLQKMKEHITANSVKKLALPRIGCGLDSLEWILIKKMLEYIFHEVDIEIKIYNFQQNYGKTKQKLQTKAVSNKETDKNKSKKQNSRRK